jgi:hypothetical protein
MTTTGIHIYHLLARRKLTRRLRDCSSPFLGMNASYLAQGGDRELSERALIHLFRRLWEERHYILAARVAWVILFGRVAQ